MWTMMMMMNKMQFADSLLDVLPRGKMKEMMINTKLSLEKIDFGSCILTAKEQILKRSDL